MEEQGVSNQAELCLYVLTGDFFLAKSWHLVKTDYSLKLFSGKILLTLRRMCLMSWFYSCTF